MMTTLTQEIASYPQEVQYLCLHPGPQMHESTQLTMNWTVVPLESPIVNRGLGKGKWECWMREGMKNM
jgi:hypothetical protein